MPVGELRIGDRLASHDGQWMAVEDLLDTGEYATVYNLRVAEHHTYFVGREEWLFSIWAHNVYNGWNDFRGATKGQDLSQQEAADIWHGRNGKTWTSPAGLVYEPMTWVGAPQPSRVQHVLHHGGPDPVREAAGKPHSIFGSLARGALQEVDAAWTDQAAFAPTQTSNNKRWGYLIDMGRPVGTNGETRVKIIVENEVVAGVDQPSNLIVSAYPWWW